MTEVIRLHEQKASFFAPDFELWLLGQEAPPTVVRDTLLKPANSGCPPLPSSVTLLLIVVKLAVVLRRRSPRSTFHSAPNSKPRLRMLPAFTNGAAVLPRLQGIGARSSRPLDLAW